MRKALAAILVVGLVLSLSGAALGDEDHEGSHRRIFPPSSHPYGTSYPEWAGAYLTWLIEIPAPDNPFIHPDSPRNCEVQGPVVFLGPSGADCRVPEGKALFLAGAFWECSTAEGFGMTFRALRRCAIQNFARDFAPDVNSFTLRIDGRRVLHPRRWVFLTPGEIIEFPDDNVTGAPGGPTKSVTKGFFYILRPLEEGRHTLRFHVVDQNFGTFNFIWTLRVVD